MSTLKIPDAVPSPSQDAESLKKALAGGLQGIAGVLKGWGVDGKTITSVLGHRNTGQRRKIREAYQDLCNESLLDTLNSNLAGDFGEKNKIMCSPDHEIGHRLEKAVILWTYDPSERDARLANAALTSKQKGVKELQVIVEIACGSSSKHLMAVRQAYCHLFECSLEEDIISNVSLPVRKLLMSLASSFRSDKEIVDRNLASSEATKLHGSIEAQDFDSDDFMTILAARNFFQLRATFNCYRQTYGNQIDQDIAGCGNGDMQALLKIVIMCIACPEKHFIEVIRSSIIGLGTDEDSLTRAIVTRAEVDMANIKEEYVNVNKETLERAVVGDTSGDYQNFLLTLIGERD